MCTFVRKFIVEMYALFSADILRLKIRIRKLFCLFDVTWTLLLEVPVIRVTSWPIKRFLVVWKIVCPTCLDSRYEIKPAWHVNFLNKCLDGQQNLCLQAPFIPMTSCGTAQEDRLWALVLRQAVLQEDGDAVHNRSSGCKGSGASGSGITDTGRFFAHSWIHWIRPFLLIKSPTHLPQASHSPLARLGTLGFGSRTTEKDISLFPIFCFVQLCSMPGWFFVSLEIKRSFLAMERENDYGPRVKFLFQLLLCLTFLIWQRPSPQQGADREINLIKCFEY